MAIIDIRNVGISAKNLTTNGTGEMENERDQCNGVDSFNV